MWRDLTHGIRVLMKNPGFAFIAVISIAIRMEATIVTRRPADV